MNCANNYTLYCSYKLYYTYNRNIGKVKIS